MGSNNRQALNEHRYTCAVEFFSMSIPIVFLQVDKSQFILANLKPDNFSLSSKENRAIFSDDRNLCEILYFMLCGKIEEDHNSIFERKIDLATV